MLTTHRCHDVMTTYHRLRVRRTGTWVAAEYPSASKVAASARRAARLSSDVSIHLQIRGLESKGPRIYGMRD
jgi:hypothetical protein